MKFNASIDQMVKMITIGTCLLFLAIIIVNISILFTQPKNMNLLLSLVATIVFFVSIVSGCYLFAPQSYEVTEREFIIQRKWKDVIFKLDDITEVRAIAEGEMKGLIRTFGVGGLFGYFGKFSASNYGSMTFYATQSKHKILIVLKDGKKIVVTPDDLSMEAALSGKLSK